MLWRTLRDEPVTYEASIEASDYFDKLILIWRTQCQSVNRRIFGSVAVQPDNELYSTVLHSASEVLSAELDHSVCEVRKLIPKDTLFSQKCFEVSYHEDELTVIFIPVQLDLCNNKKTAHIPFPYKISCQLSSEQSLRLIISVPTSATDSDCRWLLNTVFPALHKWLRFIDPHKAVRKTNNLLDLEEYSHRYKRIKEQYGRSLVENWTEKTDPKKFVYEDCGIATYLLELWRKRGHVPKKFADLGCGNGLLVHLLNKEGVDGVGIDIRKRKIWSEQLSETSLIEQIVDPSQKDNSIPSDVDYLIGNHTDELTPWMPIMAARRNIEFFVLPCCPFTFHGKYVARPGDTGSQYDSFLRFIKEICARLGYTVEEDRLSIPSTKRLCFVCSIPPQGLVQDVENVIEELTGSATKTFVARPKVERIRNCLSVPAEIRSNLTKRFFDEILRRSDERKDGWRCGGAVELVKLAALLINEEKQLMKQQCGGLQTFLRNQHQVFKVTGGMARLRDFREEVTRKTKKAKVTVPRNGVTPCWMAENHPDGCPMKDKCHFKH
ncbi:unnamed protein product [Cylicocyclus nassatus]|uniref:tRNA (uracil-O(2)-)-methyltransferase n=1 Tax=Cylicocyclus nassatus TaxID=53992 RepID=A0AA36M7U1_CYLNA|nr:unnamed protein product [Cylicocyclus nassatus]